MYLYMDGVDDSLQLPLMSVGKIVLEVEINSVQQPNAYLLDARTGHANGLIYSGSFSSGVGQSLTVTQNGLGLNPRGWAGIAKDEKILIRAVSANSDTIIDDITLFAHNNLSQGHLKGKLYSVACYAEDGSMLALYDMSTGTVLDQSGNGNHATLYGGTWVGGGDDDGTDVSFSFGLSQSIYSELDASYPLSQSVYANHNSIAPTQQALFDDKVLSYAAKQAIYANREAEAAAKQQIYANRQWAYPLLQSIYSDYVMYSKDFPLSQSVYADRSMSFPLGQVIVKDVESDYSLSQSIYEVTETSTPLRQTIYADVQAIAHTKQVIWTDRDYSYPLLQRIIDPDKSIIGHIKLEGERVLYVYLVGERELYVELKGGLPMRDNQNFSMVSGDSKLIDVTVEGVDMAGVTSAKWTMYQYGVWKLSKTLREGLSINGDVLHIELSPSDTEELTGVYTHEIEIVDSNGNVSTITRGKITLEQRAPKCHIHSS
ncbi:hypothetical protein BEP19_14755 [Ammoniphilus oxalaticus]|uniref:Uncharacterized protein n=1 Tax=Ammoniphilus oxalaticus TaxID=66863 RepID=A0A419SEH0_9BACL|nr:hypothetical protein [Ammoniphilus oxalaticus]RKD21479.1 hypothetical protein BEP19_14755 [Ammoniphilus oxalaticus]